MRIVPLVQNYTPKSSSLKFTSNNKSKNNKNNLTDHEYDAIIEAQATHLLKGCLGLGTVVAITGLVGMYTDSQHTNDKSHKNEIEETGKPTKIKQDTLTVENLDNVENPNIILYKKDGSTVVLDITN